MTTIALALVSLAVMAGCAIAPAHLYELPQPGSRTYVVSTRP